MTSLLATLGAQSWGFFIGATLPVKVYLNYHRHFSKIYKKITATKA